MAFQLHIRGRVQGVGYRAAMLDKALELGITGWVRNRRDGSVEALVCGSVEAQDAIVQWAHAGPPLAHVESVTATPVEAHFDTFDWKATA
jgi:acylphosphatase